MLGDSGIRLSMSGVSFCKHESPYPLLVDSIVYVSEGQGRMTLFASSGNARTYNYQPGDVSYVPATFGHYVENIGNTTLRFLEIFNTGKGL